MWYLDQLFLLKYPYSSTEDTGVQTQNIPAGILVTNSCSCPLDMGRCELMRGRQALELRSNLSERRALTDRILNMDSPTDHSARNLQWAIAHGTLRGTQILQVFKCFSIQLDNRVHFAHFRLDLLY